MADFNWEAVDKSIEEDARKERELSRTTVNLATKTSPDKYANIRKISEASGLPADVVERNEKEIQQRQRSKEIQTIIESSPVLREKFKDVNFARLSHDDVENLFKTENQIKPISGPEPTFKNIIKGIGSSLPQGLELTRQGIFLQWADLIGSERMKEKALKEYDRAQTGVLLSTPEMESSTAQGLYSGGTSLLRQTPGLAASLITRSTIPALASAGLMTESEAYGKYTSRGATPTEAAIGAMGEGATEVLTELLPMGFLMKKFGKVGAGDFLSGLLAREIPTEQVATIVQDAIDTAIANPDKTWGEYIEERPDAAYQTLLATLVQSGVIGGVHTASQFAYNASKSDKSLEDKEALDEIIQIAQESKLRDRAPAEYKAFLDEVLGAENNVYLAPEDAEVFFQSHPDIIEEMEEKTPDAAASLQEALESKSDVVIPKSDYITYFTDYHDELSEVIRSDQDGLSAKEAQQFIEQGDKEFEKEAVKILTEQEKRIETEASAEVVARDIKEQIVKTGRFPEDVAEKYSQLHKAFAQTMGKRLNKTPEEVYGQFGLRVKGAPIVGEKLQQIEPIKHKEYDVEFETGKPVTFKFAHNTESATKLFGVPDKESPYYRGYEPSGRYVTHISEKQTPDAPNVISGHITMNNPLVMDNNDLKWKKELSDIYDGKTGKELSKALIADGYDGVITVETKDGKPKYISEILDLTTFEEAKALFQKERGAFQPDTNVISLLENADLSTFLHESGHFFLEAMNSIPELQEDMDVIFKWFSIPEEGVDIVYEHFEVTRSEWDKMSLEEKRPYHEKFARGFEAYLFEGKAPSLELQSIFQRFRAWLVNIYRNLRNLNVELTPEVRQVFDRMLATDEQIREVEAARAYTPLFESLEESGMTETQWEEYQKLDQDRRLKSREELQTRSIKDMKWASNAKAKALRSIQKEVADKRKIVRSEVAEAVSKEPVYRAIKFFRRGEIDREGEIVKLDTHRLDIDTLNNIFPYGEDIDVPDWKSLGHGKFGMLGKDGIDPIDAANLFGYGSPDAMIRDILDAPPQKEYIDTVTDQRMLELYGDISDPIQMGRAAEEAIHNDIHTRFLHTELRMLTKGVGDKNVLARAAKQYAIQSIDKKKVRDIKPNQYLSAQSRAGDNALRALGKGDRESAIDHKRAQVLNNHFYRAANNGMKEVDKMLRYVRKFNKEQKNIDPEYLDQIYDLLGAFEFTKVSLKALDKRQTMSEFIKQQEEIGFQPIIDEALIEQSKRKNYKNMTLEEFRGHVETIQHIEHLGRLKKKLLTAKDKREFNQRVEEARLSIELNKNREAKERASPSDVLGKTGLWWRQYLASHRKFASIIREMDGGQDGGVVWNLLLRTMNESGDTETEMRAEASKDLGAIFNQIKIRSGAGNIYSPKYLIPGTDIYLTDEQRIMVALNWGNEGNRQRLLDGGLPGKKEITPLDVQKILDTLTQKEWGVVQGVWDFLETYRDQIGEQEKRLTGKTPKWVEASPIQTKYGEMRGGYFPAKYDRLLSRRSDELEAATNLRMGMKGAFNASATRSGYTQERANEVKDRPLLLSFNAITQHTNEVIHRLAWQDWLTDANRIMKALDKDIRKYYGPEIVNEMQETIRDIAAGDAPAVTPVEQAINHIRIGSTITGMGWRISTALLQPSGLAQSWVRVGGKWVAKGVKEYVKNPLGASRMVNEKSKLMRDRDRTMLREINEVLNTLKVGQKMTLFKSSFFFLIQKMQRTVDIPTWIGAYDKALVQLEYETARNEQERKEIEDRAIGMADQAVIDSQSGGQIKDLARVQRGHPFYKLLTNFYSYFSATYNLNVEAFRKTNFKKPASILNFLGDMVVLNMMPVIFTVTLREMLKGECEADLECLGEKVGQEQISYLMGQMVLLREASTAAQALAGGKYYGYTGPAGLRPIADISQLSVQIAQGEADEAFRRALLQTTGALLHLPTGQLNSTIDGFMAIENGEVEGVGSVLAPLAGPPKE